jgi:hypothetical protein
MISKIISDKCNSIIDIILTNLSNAQNQSRKILNVLNLVDFLLKNGSSKFKGEMEDEKFFFKKIKEFFLDPYDILHPPIRNAIDRIISLIEDPEALKKEREEAKKIKDKMGKVTEGIGCESNDKYEGYSSEDVKGNGYDIRPEVNLERKLELTKEKKNSEKNNKTEDFLEQTKQVEIDSNIDFLGVDDDNKNGNLEKEKKEVQEGKKKKFLPPPPKKEKGSKPNFARNNKKSDNPSDNGLLNLNSSSNLTHEKDDFFLDLNINQTTTKNSQTDVNITTQQVQSDLLNFNFLDSEKKTSEIKKDIDLLNFTQTTTSKKNDDFLDLTDLTVPQNNKKNENYLNLLSKTQPVKENFTIQNLNDNNKYEFL